MNTASRSWCPLSRATRPSQRSFDRPRGRSSQRCSPTRPLVKRIPPQRRPFRATPRRADHGAPLTGRGWRPLSPVKVLAAALCFLLAGAGCRSAGPVIDAADSTVPQSPACSRGHCRAPTAPAFAPTSRSSRLLQGAGVRAVSLSSSTTSVPGRATRVPQPRTLGHASRHDERPRCHRVPVDRGWTAAVSST